MNKIDAWSIALDETNHYGIFNADAPLIKQIRAVYLLDRNQRTHACEVTPSYWLIHLYDQVILFDDVEESQREELYDVYECHPGEDIYVHCSAIDQLIDENDHGVVNHYGDPGVSFDDVDYNDQMESLREYLCCNCPL